MKKSKVQEVDIARLAVNEGQLEWLPKNPRQWTKEDINNTMQSIREDPDFLEDRPLLVVPYDDGKFIVFAGNLRREGCAKLGMESAPCVIYYPKTDEDHAIIKRRAIKDNGTYGSWDIDALANDWDDLPLGEWGVPQWVAPQQVEGGLPPELEGKNLTPEKLEQQADAGDDGLQRVVLTYNSETEPELLALLGLEKVDKIVYDISELVK